MSKDKWRKCNFENCEALVYNRKLCDKHYNQIFKTGLLGWQSKLKINKKKNV